MLKNITLHNVGPSAEMSVNFGERLTVITGDNGLGKSFLLDVAWWALTSYWPAEINPDLASGGKALPTKTQQPLRKANARPEHEDGSSQETKENNGDPQDSKKGKIAFSLRSDGGKVVKLSSTYVSRVHAWSKQPRQPNNLGLVLYAMSDGSFAIWDPARNCWPNVVDGYDEDRPIGYIFSPAQVWEGLESKTLRMKLCNGLLVDWADWQGRNGESFARLKQVLEILSPNPEERLVPGELVRIPADSRVLPTIKMPYGQEVPIVHVSSGIRRVLALAYFLTWAWEEHVLASTFAEENPTNHITFLIDEVEAHLHPQWQRRIVPALMTAIGSLASTSKVQVIVTTHAPLVMASLEPHFVAKTDRWLDLDYDIGVSGHTEAVLTERPFLKLGDVSNWLTGYAFDLDGTYSIEASTALEKAAIAMTNADFGGDDAQRIHAELASVLAVDDPFWARWRYIAERKGWPI